MIKSINWKAEKKKMNYGDLKKINKTLNLKKIK